MEEKKGIEIAKKFCCFSFSAFSRNEKMQC